MPKNSLEFNSQDHAKHLNRSVFTLSLVSLLLAAALLLSLLYLYKLSFVKKTSLPARPLAAKTASQKPVHNFTVLRLEPAILPLKIGQSGSINLGIQTGTNLVSGVEFTLNFDPVKLEIVSVTPASFFAKPNILANKIDNKKGTWYYAIGTFTPKSGSDNLVSFVLKGKALGQSKLSFSPDTKVAAKNEGVLNVLKETIAASVEVQ